MCWLFVVKVLLMWDYIRLHHYYIRYTSVECTVGWTMSNMLTPCCESSGSFPITSCSHEISGSPYVFTFWRRRVWERGYYSSWTSSDILCTYLSVLFSQVHVWRTIQQTLTTSVLPRCIRVLENRITIIVKFLRYAIASYPDLYTPCSTTFSETCNLQWCTLDIRWTSGAVQVVD